ncbi:MAG: DUF368 domain-containing protein [Bacteroidota bacterium]
MKHYLLLILRGMAMGAADVVPGVSGGTIAFITGIYEELIDSIKSINAKAVSILAKEGFGSFWKHVNGNFLASVFGGIAISVLSLAKLISHMLEVYPIMVWAFFFGLIVASAWVVSHRITQWNTGKVLALIAGILIAYFITLLSPAETSDAWWFLFLAGALAICAMILPGISGAFILLLLGKYQFIIEALSTLNIPVIAIVGVGAIIGLLLFSNLLSFLLHRFHDYTVAVLVGFMIGALNKVWPWKRPLETFVDRHGEIKPLVEANIWPTTYAEHFQANSYWLGALITAFIGFALIIVVDRITKEK